MTSRNINLTISLGITVAIGLILYFLTGMVDSGSAKRFFTMLGGNLPTGFIQLFCYFLFFFGLLEILRLSSSVSREEKALDNQLLPEAEQYVLSADDVNDIKLKMVEVSKTSNTLLIELIKKTCTKSEPINRSKNP